NMVDLPTPQTNDTKVGPQELGGRLFHIGDYEGEVVQGEDGLHFMLTDTSIPGIVAKVNLPVIATGRNLTVDDGRDVSREEALSSGTIIPDSSSKGYLLRGSDNELIEVIPMQGDDNAIVRTYAES